MEGLMTRVFRRCIPIEPKDAEKGSRVPELRVAEADGVLAGRLTFRVEYSLDGIDWFAAPGGHANAPP
jgi:hypothetical protein